MATLLVVDDEPDTRNLLNETLTGEGHAVQAVDDGVEALAALERQPFDLALLDIRLPGLSGLELLERIKELVPTLPVIMVTGWPDAETAIQALRRGACDYVRRPFELAYLVTAVHKALAGHRPAEEARQWGELTERERAVLALLAAGKTDREIAQALRISPKTVGNHVSRILDKLGVDSRTEAAVWAVKAGFTGQSGQ